MTSRFPMPAWLVILGLIVYYPVMGVFYIIDGPSNAYQKHKMKKPIRPLPRRKRALTLPLPDSSSPWYRKGSCQKTFDQSQSPFFRLPWELRQIIYHQALVPPDGADLHVAMTEHRLCGIPCSESNSSHRGWQHNCWEPVDSTGRSIEYSHPIPFRSRGIFGPLLSCRKIYSEAVDLLYIGSTLNIRSTKVIMAMKRVMVPRRLNSIFSLHLDTEAIHPMFNTKRGSLKWPTDVLWYWKGACEVLSKMQGLHNLQISLTRENLWASWNPVIEGLVWLLQPLMTVRQVPNFNVTIYWPRSVDLDVLRCKLGGKPPFRLEVVVAYMPECHV